ncbi:YggT family protein [Clostridia bacterium]|nr:YggT family protein [Clostridia bacterium]
MIRDFVQFAFNVLTWLIVARAILSWLPNARSNRWYRSLVELTETFISPIRKLLPANNSMIDIAPMVTIVIIILLENLVMGIL